MTKNEELIFGELSNVNNRINLLRNDFNSLRKQVNNIELDVRAAEVVLGELKDERKK